VGSPPSIKYRGAAGLCHATILVRTGVYGTHGHNHPKLGRHDIQPLGAVLSDPHHIPTSARTGNTVRLDHLFDPFQMARQVAKVALRALALLARLRHLDCV